MLVAALSTAVFVGAYDLGANSGPSAGSGSETATNAGGASGDGEAPVELAPFTTADAGSCLMWDVAADGTVSNFDQTSCAEDHRFEVSAREDLGLYPTSEFGDDAPLPDLERQAELRQELCHSATISYLEGQYDPAGKYSIAPILPSEAAWNDGDRTLLCGLQTTDEDGMPQITQGNVAAVDQANIAQPGDCRAIDDQQVLRTVPCGEPHQLETVAVVDLSERFPEGVPSVEDQDKFLAGFCAAAAERYMLGEENLYQSTLQPYWGTVAEDSWIGGTRSVNCSVMHANPDTGSFSTITGSATDGRDALSIDGAPPTPQPERNPLREPNE